MMQDWSDIKTKLFTPDIPALLLGNGFSINLYGTFEYNSLYEKAVEYGFLSDSEQKLFTSLDTTNFEYVLRTIKHAELYLKSYEITGIKEADADPTVIYKRIREALVNVIIDIHCKWNDNDSHKFEKIHDALKKYSSIFTTNYDLLLYWSVMADGKNTNRFKDFFWNSNSCFDLSNSKLSKSSIPIFYLHGSLFIYRDLYSYAYKRISDVDSGQSLLDIIKEPAEGEESPLIVAEGEDSKKHSSISSSDYLEFCFNSLNNLNKNLVIFGHNLNKDHDRHIVDILKKLIVRQKIAISIYNPTKDSKRSDEEMTRYEQHLGVSKGNPNLLFFYSHDHPLGNPDLALDRPPPS